MSYSWPYYGTVPVPVPRSVPNFDPHHVDLTITEPRDIICYLNAAGHDESTDNKMGLRIGSIFVILVTSSLAVLSPVLSTRVRFIGTIPLPMYLFARYFGAGVIIATAFIHLLDPAYKAIGPASCVGMSPGWDGYSWPVAIAMTSVMCIFLMDFSAEWYVEKTYGCSDDKVSEPDTARVTPVDRHMSTHSHMAHQFLHSADQDSVPNVATIDQRMSSITGSRRNTVTSKRTSLGPGRRQSSKSFGESSSHKEVRDVEADVDGTFEKYAARLTENATNKITSHTSEIPRPRAPSPFTIQNPFAEDDGGSVAPEDAAVAFRSQISTFSILECGIIFHSVIIGLNLGVSPAAQFIPLFPVITFHQAFEGLGIGARLSVIPFPPRLSWVPWFLCALYGLTTPVSIAIGMAVVGNGYESTGPSESMVSGILDSISAGILLYTGLVELLARDFLFNPTRTRNGTRLCYMLFCLFLGIFLMSLLGKWA